mmetsp:Transcript_19916/g.45223  ORF Transcript_19916/g.45223 Transcript_19916/m.45223 type:complete len:256 (-) Transcript_19916:785-1552(-)
MMILREQHCNICLNTKRLILLLVKFATMMTLIQQKNVLLRPASTMLITVLSFRAYLALNLLSSYPLVMLDSLVIKALPSMHVATLIGFYVSMTQLQLIATLRVGFRQLMTRCFYDHWLLVLKSYTMSLLSQLIQYPAVARKARKMGKKIQARIRTNLLSRHQIILSTSANFYLSPSILMIFVVEKSVVVLLMPLRLRNHFNNQRDPQLLPWQYNGILTVLLGFLMSWIKEVDHTLIVSGEILTAFHAPSSLTRLT